MGKYFLVKNLHVHELASSEFVNTFIKKGSFYALSYNTKIDQDNSVALLPTGKLILSVDKDTYEELGLDGTRSHYAGKNPMRYIIKIDLTEAAFTPDAKKYKRVTWALTEKKPLMLDFLVAWHNTSGDKDKSTIKSYFSKYETKEYYQKSVSRTLRNVQCPTLQNQEMIGKPEEACSVQEFFDWLGAVSNNIDCNNSADSFISTYCCPQPSTILDQAHLCTVTGFIIPEKVYELLEQLRLYFDEPKLSQWLTLTVHGFADSPVSWRENEHGFHKGGENVYNFVIFNNQDYWLQMAVGTNDDCPP
ncbi:ribonuclease P protein subunit p40 isoform X2 [Ambystoma mexicanum]